MPDRRRAPVRALDPPMVPVALTGTLCWAIIGGVLLATDAPAEWRWTCLAGLLIGVGLLVFMAVRDRRRHQRPASTSS